MVVLHEVFDTLFQEIQRPLAIEEGGVKLFKVETPAPVHVFSGSPNDSLANLVRKSLSWQSDVAVNLGLSCHLAHAGVIQEKVNSLFSRPAKSMDSCKETLSN